MPFKETCSVKGRGADVARPAGSTLQREVFDIVGFFRLFAIDEVFEGHPVILLSRHTIAQYERFAGGELPRRAGNLLRHPLCL